MSALWIIGMLAGAPVVVHLTESANLPPNHPREIVVALTQGIERSIDKQVVVDDLSSCQSEPECIEEIGAQYATDDVLLLRLVGAVRTGRALVSIGRPGKGIVRRVDLEYPLDRSTEWPAIFGGLAAILFPDQLRPTTREVAVAIPPPIEEESIVGDVVSWTAIGAGVALGITATGLRISANNIRSDVDGLTLEDPMRADMISSSNAQGLASNLLFGSAAVAVACGAVYLLTR